MSDEETSRPRAAPVSDNNIKSSSFYWCLLILDSFPQKAINYQNCLLWCG
jgi:hypothetical protein